MSAALRLQAAVRAGLPAEPFRFDPRLLRAA